jgi:hypothetical protein
VTLIPIYLWLFPSLHPQFESFRDQEQAEALRFDGAEFPATRYSSSRVRGSAREVSGLLQGEAILSVQTVFKADQYPFLEINFEGGNPDLKLFLFWHTAEHPDRVQYLELVTTEGGSNWVDLTRNELWGGTVEKLVLGVFGDLRDETFVLRELAFLPYGALGILGTIWTEWRHFSPWEQISINHYRGAPLGSLLLPAYAAAIWALTACIASLAMTRVRQRGQTSTRSTLYATPGVIIGLAWLVLEALWLQRISVQHRETTRQFAGKTLHERKLADWDGDSYRISQQIAAALEGETRDLAIVFDGDKYKAPVPQRIRYHLLPEFRVREIVNNRRRDVRRIGREYEYVLVLSDANANGTAVDENAVIGTLSQDTAGNGEPHTVFTEGFVTLVRLPVGDEDLSDEEQRPVSGARKAE